MYLSHTKTLLRKAASQTFDADYPEPDFRDLHVSIEFPVKRQHYPSMWVDFEPTTALAPVGMGHLESTLVQGAGADPDTLRVVTRWRFQGLGTYTVVALSSLERDRLYDEMVRVLAFGHEQPATSVFRSILETDPLVAMNGDFDKIEQRGFAAAPGTPWGTDDVLYEGTIGIGIVGEFVSDALTPLLPLSAIHLYPYVEGQPDPLPEEGANPWL